MQLFEFSGRRQLIGYPMEARKMVRAPVREMRAEMSVISVCCARTDARPGNGARGLKPADQPGIFARCPDARPGNGARGLKL